VLVTVLAISNGATAHESRQLPSWLIFDVSPKMRSGFAARVPKGAVLYRTPELPLGRVQPLLLKALTVLQALSSAPQQVKLIEDWLDHDGLEFAKGAQPLASLFAIASTPRALFEKTAKDDSVYLRAESEDGIWMLRVRTDWDADDRDQVGDFCVVVSAEFSAQFEEALEPEMDDGSLHRDEERG
jgi:hypothetical protein